MLATTRQAALADLKGRRNDYLLSGNATQAREVQAAMDALAAGLSGGDGPLVLDLPAVAAADDETPLVLA